MTSPSDWLAERFERHRPRLRSVAYRMLGSSSEAEDAVQEAWIRLSRTDTDAVENLGGWLTTVVGRVCLDLLRSRTSRREQPMDADAPEQLVSKADWTDPEHEAVVADSVGLALLVVLETLTPAERVAFVLHDTFGVPFDEIGPIVGRSPTAARQLASRARRKVRGASPAPRAELDRQRAVVDAFLAAARGGDFAGLIAVLDPDVVVRADAAAVAAGAEREVRGAEAVVATFAGRARGARSALVDGVPGAVWSVGRRPRIVFDFTIVEGRIVAIDLIADPEQIARIQVEPAAG